MELHHVLGLGAAAARIAERHDFSSPRICSTPEEFRQELRSARVWTLLLIDGSHPGADRDLLSGARRSGGPVVVIARADEAHWLALGASATVGPDATAEELIAALESLPSSQPPLTPPRREAGSPLAPVVAVTGPGGTGASTTAVALAQGLTAPPAEALLLDLCLHAEQHVLHGLDPTAAGIAELTEAHRSGRPSPDQVRAASIGVPGRGYRVIPGLRRSVAWAALRPIALAAALDTLRTAFAVVVCDTDADLEGEAEGGSVDVEERNAMARLAVGEAAACVVVARPGVKYTHCTLRVLTELWTRGSAPDRTVIAFIGDRADAEALRRAVGLLGADPILALVPPLDPEPLLLNGLPLPPSMVDPLREAVAPLVSGAAAPAVGSAVPIVPGSLGTHPEHGS